MKVTLLILVVYCSTRLLFADAQYFSCPPLEEDMAGICVQNCNSDTECDEGKMCCSNGCGNTCTTPIPVPYIQPLLQCPVIDPQMVGTCVEGCDTNANCSTGELCCSNGCGGHTCVEGLQPMTLCASVREEQMNQSLIGAYVPQCEDDGSFSLEQCHGSTGYCWCVDGQSGVPISDVVRFGVPTCNCTYGDVVHLIGETFAASGGDCETCTCTLDGVVCPPCPPPIEERLFYSCPALRKNVVGVCVETCESDADCAGLNKCCSNGCGHTCTQPEIIPYIPLPRTCPDPDVVPCRVNGEEITCINRCGGGEYGDDGEDGEGGEDGEDGEDEDSDSSESSESSRRHVMCCDNTCGGSACVPPAIDAIPCFTLRDIIDASNTTLLGSYNPRCDGNGEFDEVQCRSHYCWCVDVLTGRPRSHLVAFESTEDLHCTRCHYRFSVYEHLDTFTPDDDDCNICSCFAGEVTCTELDCLREDDGGWQWWSTVLVTCIVVVIVLGLITMALLLIVLMLVRQNTFRHRRLKETDQFEIDTDAVHFRNGHESIELKVPVEDVEGDDDTAEPVKA